MKKALNMALFLSFMITIMVPVTGIHVHKLAATAFLLLSCFHMMTCRKKMSGKRWLLFVVILVSFGSGVCGMVLDRCPIILKIHRGISIMLVFFWQSIFLCFIKNVCQVSGTDHSSSQYKKH